MTPVIGSRRSRWWSAFAFWGALLAAAGCGSAEGPKRHRVTGTVTYGDSPVPKGFIHFEPDTSRGNSGPGGGAMIDGGRFATEPGQGVVGGPHLVKVVGFDGVPYTSEEGLKVADGRPLFDRFETTADFPRDRDAQLDLKVPKSGR